MATDEQSGHCFSRPVTGSHKWQVQYGLSLIVRDTLHKQVGDKLVSSTYRAHLSTFVTYSDKGCTKYCVGINPFKTVVILPHALISDKFAFCLHVVYLCDVMIVTIYCNYFH